MIVRSDIHELWAMRDHTKDVQVVKHDYKTKLSEKYLGAKNEDYQRKNWSRHIRYTMFHVFATTPMADEWHRERIYTEYSQKHGL